VKQLEKARRQQGYMRHTNRCCRHCINRKVASGGDVCTLGGFKVGLTAFCQKGWEPREISSVDSPNDPFELDD